MEIKVGALFNEGMLWCKDKRYGCFFIFPKNKKMCGYIYINDKPYHFNGTLTDKKINDDDQYIINSVTKISKKTLHSFLEYGGIPYILKCKENKYKLNCCKLNRSEEKLSDNYKDLAIGQTYDKEEQIESGFIAIGGGRIVVGKFLICPIQSNTVSLPFEAIVKQNGKLYFVEGTEVVVNLKTTELEVGLFENALSILIVNKYKFCSKPFARRFISNDVQFPVKRKQEQYDEMIKSIGF